MYGNAEALELPYFTLYFMLISCPDFACSSHYVKCLMGWEQVQLDIVTNEWCKVNT